MKQTKFFVFALLFVFFSSGRADAGECPSVWSDVLAEIESGIQEQDIDDRSRILFLGLDGRLFNCLNIDISRRNLREVEWIASHILNTAKGDDLSYNSLICGVVEERSSSRSYDYVLYLPYTRGELSSKICISKISRSISKVLGRE